MKVGSFDLTKRVMIVAEIGGNHNGDFRLAKRYIKEAAKCGADVVKFQMYQAENLVSRDLPPLPLVRHKFKTQFERFRALEFTEEEWVALSNYAKKYQVMFSASVFDIQMADLLDKISCMFKIASGDLTNLPLIRHVVNKKKPILLSTGFARIDEIDRVVKEIPKNRLILLHCVGSYPCTLEDAYLLTIPFLKQRYGVIVGYSDHTLGTFVSKIAVALGARVIEKHFTLDRSQGFGDHILSIEPHELKELIGDIRKIEKTLRVKTSPLKSEMRMRRMLRRSLAARVDISAGTVLNESILTALRPAIGISPLEVDCVIGRKSRRSLKKGEILRKKDVKP
jgi:sialic acid synthase SpsE